MILSLLLPIFKMIWHRDFIGYLVALCVVAAVPLLIQGIDCPDDYFLCVDESECIPSYWFCDNIKDCKDNSDEIRYNELSYTSDDGISCSNQFSFDRTCLLPKNQRYKEEFICGSVDNCRDDWFLCADRKGCILGSWLCDSANDCRDGSDEVRYYESIHSLEDGISCRSKTYLFNTCLLPTNQTHKEDSLCSNGVCHKDHFECVDESRCIPRTWLCDAEEDCRDGSDEIRYNESIHSLENGTACRNQYHLKNICLLPSNQSYKEEFICRENDNCTDSEFKCVDGSFCVNGSKLCDIEIHCIDGSDEIQHNASLHTFEVHGVSCLSKSLDYFCLLPRDQRHKKDFVCTECPLSHYECMDGSACIEGDRFCDSVLDCHDGSDELTPATFSSDVGIECRNKIRTNNVCLLPNNQTHKESHICYKELVCKENEFACLDGSICIPGSKLCDKNNDCSDKSDEIRYKQSLEDYGVPCRNQRYLNEICLLPTNQSFKESSICRPNSDCQNNEFKCADGSECISRFLFCNSYDNCNDGSDEVRYDSSVHTSSDGISCRNQMSLNNICLLPAEQSHKESKICRPNTNCPDDMFLCSDGSECIYGSWVCDAEEDCDDGSDEILFNSAINSAEYGVSCINKFLINNICLLPKNQSHKATEICRENSECDDDEFKCADGSECIRGSWLCDSEDDCGDKSDEIHYNASVHSATGDVACRNQNWLNNICVLPRNQSYKEAHICKRGTDCRNDQFKCTDGSRCISSLWICDYSDCLDGSDEILYNTLIHTKEDGIPCRNKENLERICLLPNNQSHKEGDLCSIDSTCNGSGEILCPDGTRCLLNWRFCDGNQDCSGGSDEIPFNATIHTEEQGIACHSYHELNNVCLLFKNQTLKSSSFCRQDETCGEHFKCLDTPQCIPNTWFCDGRQDCDDSSDEIPYDSFTHLPSEGIQCLNCFMPNVYVCDGKVDCRDGSDECSCNSSKIFCNGESDCQYGIDECFCVGGNVRNNSVFSDERCFRCLDRSKIIPSGQLCDGIIHCDDLSDECLCLNQNANLQFICTAVTSGNLQASDPASRCLSKTTVCDGRFDCPTRIDEEFCEKTSVECEAKGESSSNGSIPKCDYNCPQTDISTKMCDGVPRCPTLQDECSVECPNRPHFCDFRSRDGKFSCPNTKNPINGSEVCNGRPDCNPSEPSQSEDESKCPNRFYCKNSNPIHVEASRECDFIADCTDESDEFEEGSLDKCNTSHFYCNGGSTKYIRKNSQLCDGNADCDNAGDECQNCTEGIFSSDKAMISTEPLIPFLWIISILATFGNAFVIIYMIRKLIRAKGKGQSGEKSQNVLVLNLAFADVLVGIYTLVISIQNNILSKDEKYCREDQRWRSGSTCAAMGAILMIGSELSVFSLAAITAMRLKTILRPFSKTSMMALYICLSVSWLLTIIIGIVPLLPSDKDYFIESIWYSKNSFVSFVQREEVESMTKTLVYFLNKSPSYVDEIRANGNWTLLITLIKELNESYVPAREFGYYSSHGVCLPRLFPDPRNDAAWGFSLFIIIINFASFLFVLIGYIIILKSATTNRIMTPSTATRAAALQRKVTRIVITDFLCWMPICIMAFIQLSGVDIPKEVYVPVGTILIPINSALNPFLYSDAPEWLWKKLMSVRTIVRQRSSTMLSYFRITTVGKERAASISQFDATRDTNFGHCGKMEMNSFDQKQSHNEINSETPYSMAVNSTEQEMESKVEQVEEDFDKVCE